MSSLRMRVEELSPHTPPCIYKVPRNLLDINMKAYEPKLIAIGPYHHGQSKFKTIEELKLRYFSALLQRKPNVKVENYVSVITKMEKKARDCYAEPCLNLIDSKTFTDMLVLDGCFIIELMQTSPQDLEVSFPFRSSCRILQRDLILLENQIPWFVLCELFDLVEGPGQHSLLIERVLKFCLDVFPRRILHSSTKMKRSEEVKHILDLIYINWCPPSSSDHHQTIIKSDDEEGWYQYFSIPCASQLKDANVTFRNCIVATTTTLFDLEFKGDGKMVMPTLDIEDSTESLLRNLIAYEQFLPEAEPTPVTDYALLLDSLINTCKDVQILTHSKIISNKLGSDNAVVEFVNRLTDGIVI